MTSRADRAAARTACTTALENPPQAPGGTAAGVPPKAEAVKEAFLAEVAAARTTDEVRAVWARRALRTTAFCLLDRPAREHLFHAAVDAIARINNSELPAMTRGTPAGGDSPGITAGSSGTQKDSHGN
jgi:hypothetical protein